MFFDKIVCIFYNNVFWYKPFMNLVYFNLHSYTYVNFHSIGMSNPFLLSMLLDYLHKNIVTLLQMF